MTGQVVFESIDQQIRVFGPFDRNIRDIEKKLSVMANLRDSTVDISGAREEDVKKAVDTLNALKRMYDDGEQITDTTVSTVMELVNDGDVEETLHVMKDVIVLNSRAKPVKCRTIGQKSYVKALQDNTVTLCIGPAGTGKTFLAVACAVAALKENEIERIIMSRPAIEAGEERLGFLPGDLAQKVDPYLRPLYDALNDILGAEQVARYMEKGTIEIAPLAYMRGRTLNRAMVIIDEGQNASLPTLKMALTRLGEGFKMVLTGDVTQIDLPKATSSGLERCAQILKGIDGISVIRLTNRDVVRHRIVREIVRAFEKEEKIQEEKRTKINYKNKKYGNK